MCNGNHHMQTNQTLYPLNVSWMLDIRYIVTSVKMEMNDWTVIDLLLTVKNSYYLSSEKNIKRKFQVKKCFLKWRRNWIIANLLHENDGFHCNTFKLTSTHSRAMVVLFVYITYLNRHESEYWGHPFRVEGIFPSIYHQWSVQLNHLNQQPNLTGLNWCGDVWRM